MTRRTSSLIAVAAVAVYGLKLCKPLAPDIGVPAYRPQITAKSNVSTRTLREEWPKYETRSHNNDATGSNARVVSSTYLFDRVRVLNSD
ncbi:MAG: hypothetical protein OXI96_04850 [Acidimicrobiaceae bacterium]|nr:hypothetical protein [Acidimicrobiaceae bacterium]